MALPLLARRRWTGWRRSARGSRSPAGCRGRPGCSAPPSPLWVAGFDLFYALFDLEVDRREGLHSDRDALRRQGRLPRRAALARRHVACLVAAGLGLPVGALYWLGVAAVAALLAYEHALVRPHDLRRLDTAFFTMNGVISVAFAVFVIADAAL